MKYASDTLKDNPWLKRYCTLLNPNSLPRKVELDCSDFVCEEDISNSIVGLIGSLGESDPKIYAKMKKSHVSSYSSEEHREEPDTIIEVDKKHLNRMCMKNGSPRCICYSFPCRENVRNQLCNSITVQYEVENTAPYSCPVCKSKIVPENKSSSTLYDIRLQGKLGRARFEYTRYRCSNKYCKKRLPAYQLPNKIKYVDEQRKSRFTTRLQNAVVEGLIKNYQPKRISQGYGFSIKLAHDVAKNASNDVKTVYDSMEHERIKKESAGKVPSKLGKEEKIAGRYYVKEYYSTLLKLPDSSLHAVFSLGSMGDIRLTYVISEADWDWLEHLVKCDFSPKNPPYSTAELNVLLYNYGRSKYPRVDHSLSYLLLRLALSFALAHKRGEHLNYVAIKELEIIFTHLPTNKLIYWLKESLEKIRMLSDNSLVKIEAKKALRYIKKVSLETTDCTLEESRINPQTEHHIKQAIEAIETASIKCEGNSEYIVGRILYLNSAVLPFTYHFGNKHINLPLDGSGEFELNDFEEIRYEGIPLHCLMHLMESGLLNDIDCPKITCSTERVPNSSAHPCGIVECPYMGYDE